MDYPHLTFRNQWEITSDMAIMLGECKSLVNTLMLSPLTPEAKENLQNITLRKGALSTTAIEGNTVTDEEFDNIVIKNKNLPPSRKYQEIEVKNVVNSMNDIINSVIGRNFQGTLSSELICRFHRSIMAGLEEFFEIIPGKFRNNEVVVGSYKPPEHLQIPAFIEKYCNWLNGIRENDITNTIIKAVVAHIYFEWIHPFGDGNGRTGRFLEYYILIRGGFPVIAGHILSNFYNNTRDRYYKFLDTCRKKQNLTDFLYYAIEGLRDGLAETFETVRQSQISIFWQRFIYDTFDKMRRSSAFKRKRKLILNFPMDKGLKLEFIPMITNTQEYFNRSIEVLYHDVKEMVKNNLLYKEGDKYFANYKIVCQEFFTVSRK